MSITSGSEPFLRFELATIGTVRLLGCRLRSRALLHTTIRESRRVDAEVVDQSRATDLGCDEQTAAVADSFRHLEGVGVHHGRIVQSGQRLPTDQTGHVGHDVLGVVVAGLDQLGRSSNVRCSTVAARRWSEVR